MAETGGCCSCCCSFIFTLGLTALFMWLSLRTSNPKCTIYYFYLPALNKTLNDSTNTTLYLSLRLENTNKDKGVYYDDLNLTFSLPNPATATAAATATANSSSSSIRHPIIATDVVPRFYQGHKKKAKKPVVVGPDKLNWTAVAKGVYPNGTVNFRVDLATAVRFKIMAWKTKKHRLFVGADVQVNDSGGKVYNKDIKLSAAPDHQLVKCFFGQLGVLANLLVLIFLNFW